MFAVFESARKGLSALGGLLALLAVAACDTIPSSGLGGNAGSGNAAGAVDVTNTGARDGDERDQDEDVPHDALPQCKARAIRLKLPFLSRCAQARAGRCT